MSTFDGLGLAPREIDLPEVVAEVTEEFLAYERALMGNDVASLINFFWDAPGLTRYGIADRQLGMEEMRAFRASTPAPNFSRSLHNLRVHSFGLHMAVAQVEFVRSDSDLRGFQTQTWVRMAEGWRIVSAHVSMIDFVP